MAGTRRTREVIFAGDLDPAPILDDIIDLVFAAISPTRLGGGSFLTRA